MYTIDNISNITFETSDGWVYTTGVLNGDRYGMPMKCIKVPQGKAGEDQKYDAYPANIIVDKLNSGRWKVVNTEPKTNESYSIF